MKLKLALIFILTGLLAGCNTMPVLNFDNQQATLQKSASLNQMGKLISEAALSKKWQPSIVSPGVIHATHQVRTHSASVEITYTANSYNINYRDSTNLKYDQAAGTIHRNYNRWINNLKNAIDNNISRFNLGL